jgi:hypothetical protein
MLDLPRYLLGVAEIGALAGFATMGAATLRALMLPRFSGAPAFLATGVLALVILIWVAECLGTVGWFEPAPYVIAVAATGLGAWTLLPRVASRWGCPSPPEGCGGQGREAASVTSLRPEQRAGQEGHPHLDDRTRGRALDVITLIAVAIAAVAIIHFAAGVKTRLSTGMTGFDSTWYHGPFAAGFFQSGDTWSLHFIAPQFLAWFYPANAELFHAAGMLAFGRDVLSPLLNLGWFLGSLLALWCIGQPYRVAPWSLALGAIALSVPALSDQAGEARNDIVGIFFLLAAVAVAVNAWAAEPRSEYPDRRTAGKEVAASPRSSLTGAWIVTGLAAGLAAGAKLNFLLPAAVLVIGFAFVAPAGSRWRALWVSTLAAVAGGGYWYLRNLLHTGNPLPWFDHVGPISLPAPDQALGGREGHSVLSYATDGTVWSDWFLPGLHHGLTVFWPLFGILALAGLVLCLARGGPVLRVAALAALAAGLAWLVAPTSASGPDGMPRGFESGLRYLSPALVLGLALLPAALPPHRLPKSASWHLPAHWAGKCELARGGWVALVGVALLAVAVWYPVQRHYLLERYAEPTFAAPGLNAAFKWADALSGTRIATTSTRQYPLYGTDLSNHVQYVGEKRPHGGFEPPATCPQWRRLLNAGRYDYVVTTRDRLEPTKPPYPPTARWTAGPWAETVLAKPPTKVYKLTAPLEPSACP